VIEEVKEEAANVETKVKVAFGTGPIPTHAPLTKKSEVPAKC
jgi:hypothetical protein